MSVCTTIQQHSASKNFVSHENGFSTLTWQFWKWISILFLLPEGLSPTVNLGTNAFLSIQIVSMMPGAPNQSVPSLTSAAEALLLLSPGQVCSHHPCDSAQAAQTTRCMHQCVWLAPICVFAAAQPAKATNVCRFFPECKNVDCQFYHPKVRQKIWLYEGYN